MTQPGPSDRDELITLVPATERAIKIRPRAVVGVVGDDRILDFQRCKAGNSPADTIVRMIVEIVELTISDGPAKSAIPPPCPFVAVLPLMVELVIVRPSPHIVIPAPVPDVLLLKLNLK